MKKLSFSIDINAPRQQLWETLWSDSTYREWTSVFSEGSHAVGDWKEGSKVLFLNGKGEGMHSLIEKNVPNELMSIRHLGMVSNGVEQPGEGHAKEALETYHLKDNGGTVQLSVELDTPEDYVGYFQDVFPKSLEKVKEIAERGREAVGNSQ